MVAKLQVHCDQTINIAKYCAAPDIYPNFQDMKKELFSFDSTHILLLAVGEYLRFSIKKEENPDTSEFASFWKKQTIATSKLRIIVPMFCAEDLFNAAVPDIDERQVDSVWDLDLTQPDDGEYHIKIYSPIFNGLPIDNFEPILGIQEWLLEWEDNLSSNTRPILTQLCSGTKNMVSNVSVEVMERPYHFVRTVDPFLSSVNEELLSQKQWLDIYGLLKIHNSLQAAILSKLNMREWDTYSIMVNWHIAPLSVRLSIWLWFNTKKDDSYISHVFHKITAKNLQDVDKQIVECIADNFSNEKWIEEREKLLEGMQIKEFSSSFLDKLAVVSLEKRLSFINCETHLTQTFAVRVVTRAKSK